MRDAGRPRIRFSMTLYDDSKSYLLCRIIDYRESIELVAIIALPADSSICPAERSRRLGGLPAGQAENTMVTKKSEFRSRLWRVRHQTRHRTCQHAGTHLRHDNAVYAKIVDQMA